MTAIIEARGLERTYDEAGAAVRALAGVDLAVERGEFVAVMGPSGSGKSTLLHLLGGLDRPSGGELWLDGERVDGLSEGAWAKRRRRQVGYVFQFFNLISNLSASGNAELPALLAGVPAGEARARRERLFDSLGIADRAGAVPARLSGGEQQRVALARALINDPALLLADEPTGNLDSRAAAEVLALLAESHARGQTIVLVTHDPRVAATADRVVRMRDGVIVAETQIESDGGSARTLASLIELEA